MIAVKILNTMHLLVLTAGAQAIRLYDEFSVLTIYILCV